MKKMTIVDVHSHFFIPEYLQAVKDAGFENNGVPFIDGSPLPHWTEDSHLQMMEENGINTSILSAPAIHFAKGKQLVELARSFNQAAYDIKTKNPGRFGAFTTLPLPDVNATLNEISESLDVLNFEGVAMFTNYNGIYLGDERFDAVFDELNSRKAVVFVHPATPPVSDDVMLDVTGVMLEFPFDSVRAVMNLVRSGTMERCPDIKFIITHGGGILPFMAPRIGSILAASIKQPQQEFIRKIVSAIRSLYFDFTAVTHPGALASSKALMPTNHILTGFDFPTTPAAGIPAIINSVCSFNGFTDEDRNAFANRNWHSMLATDNSFLNQQLNTHGVL
jgi:6-methylsalicylate decarboxylase